MLNAFNNPGQVVMALPRPCDNKSDLIWFDVSSQLQHSNHMPKVKPLCRSLAFLSGQNLDTCTQELKHNPAHPESFRSKVPDIKATLQPNRWPLRQLHSTLYLCRCGQSRRAALISLHLHLCWRGSYRRFFPPRDFISPTTSDPQPPGADGSFEAPGARLLSLVLLQGNGKGQVPAETCWVVLISMSLIYCGFNLKRHSLLLRFMCDRFLWLESKRGARRVCQGGPEIGLNYAESSGCFVLSSNS